MSSPGTPAPVGELGTAPSAATVAQGLELSATPHEARPPLDRDFRPDVEGLRAVAVATVVLFHAGVPGFSGGYVGVDVFFVISGFVITKLLLRQVERRGRPVFSEFYARRHGASCLLPAWWSWARCWLPTAKLAVLTIAIIAASLAWSVYYTSADPTGAYFATTTRAWELALGGLLAAGAAWFSRLPSAVYPVAGWAGIGAIVASVGWFSTTTSYPGWLALLPVGGAALVILAGYRVSLAGPERALGTRGFRWVGKLSFSIYLWHWPLLELATQDATHPLSLLWRLGLVALSVAGAALTFASWKIPCASPGGWPSIGLQA